MSVKGMVGLPTSGVDLGFIGAATFWSLEPGPKAMRAVKVLAAIYRLSIPPRELLLNQRSALWVSCECRSYVVAFKGPQTPCSQELEFP